MVAGQRPSGAPTHPPAEPGEGPLVFAVTGASRGLGLELVTHIQRDPAGHTVIALVRSPGTAGGLAKDRVHEVQCDVSDEESVQAAARRCAELVDRIDVLVNNAGIIGPGLESAGEATRGGMAACYATNVIGPMLVTQALLPLLRRAPGVPRCVMMSSGLSSNLATRKMQKTLVSYACSKAALNMLASQLAVSERGMCTIAFAPGWCDTDLGRSVGAPPHRAEVTMAAGLQLFKTLDLSHSGQFLSWEGKEHPY
eukprot:TRINITY_DN3250_c0_g1_i1.p1 TRINITY_DN3250_c0_g1~~TRINITY_DN3250_c0_g1_i1.p1  ORF type:complete len:254 (+),score=79.03 TRINITY_DN3250_c0_g1_i1:78-839(+)